MRKNNWYWCAQWTDSYGMITEAGNKITEPELIEWLSDNLESLPAGEGKIIRKRAS